MAEHIDGELLIEKMTRLRGCSCSYSDGIIDEVEDIMSDLPTADVIEREKIDKAIAEIEQAICSYGFCFVSRGMNLALDILKKNIGENK